MAKSGIKTVAVEKKKRANPKMSQGNKLAQSGRCMGLDRATGAYRADASIRSFSWDK